MGRKRKIPIADEEKENTNGKSRQRAGGVGAAASNSMMLHGPMYTIMSNVQLNETSHKKYIKELQQLYTKMDHDAFMFTLIKMIKTAMVAEEGNEYAETTLLFCSKFVSSYDGDDTHPVLIDICKWLLTTISRNPHIRFRICQFVNMILKALGQEAALDDAICDRIMEYMLHRLHDTSPNVRVQAILAMQRLQVPDNPDDPVLRAYQFHLCSDPSSRVRQAVITCMGRNYHTIPYILERLWDIDEKVRRHTYLHMSSYPVRSYKVSQRLTLLQQGLNDRSDSVRKVVVTIMLQQWIESYQKDLLALISALKLDSSETEIDRFRKVAKQTLKEIFKHQNKDDLLACIPLEEDCEMHRCVPYEKLTMEIALYWQCLTEFLQSEMAEEFDLVVPELSTFCTYVEKFCQLQKPDMDKFDLMEFQYKLLSLMEILYTFDLGDEIGRGNLQKLLAYLLKTFRLDEKVIEVIVRCAENLITDQNARIQFFVEIIQEICELNSKQNDLLHDRTLISELLASSSNADLNLKLSSLKVKILDLEEQEMNFVQRKDYMRAQQITEEKHATTEEYTNLLRPLLDKHPNAEMLKGPLQLRKALKPECILKSLQIAFYMVVSPKVRSLNPSILKLYNEFICRHLASNQIAIRDWALKCGTACSMLYEALAKDVFEELYAQFFKNHNIRIWETSITCIFELLDRYGLDNFAKQEEQNKTKKSGRQLYNTLEFLDSEDDSNVLSAGQGVDVIYMMSHFLDTCDDTCIVSAIIVGFCRLILRGYIKSSDIIEKLLLRYFNPSTDSNINQILGVFLENLILRKKHGLLQPCLLPMISTVLSAPYENPLHDIRPETITKFIIDSTRQESSPICDGNIHNKIAKTFLQEMLNNLSNKELCKLLAKELITLDLNVTQNPQMRCEMKEAADKLIKADFDPKTIKHIIDFKDLVDGNYNPMRKTVTNDSEGEEDSNDETENEAAKEDDDTATVTTAVSETQEEPLHQPPPQPPPPDGTTVYPITHINNTPPPAAIEEVPTASTTTDAPTSQTHTDCSIITKDISPPSARVATTYGRENRVGHRYLRKSLNSARGQSDTEIGDGPQRSPKIRIEARIDSDKKREQPEREERPQVRNTRARRNLRYVGGGGGRGEGNDDENVESSKESGVTNTRRRNINRANQPIITVTTAATAEGNRTPRSKSNTAAKETSSARKSVSPSKRQKAQTNNKEQSNEEGVEHIEQAQSPNRTEQSNKQSNEHSNEPSNQQSNEHSNQQSTEHSNQQSNEQANEQSKEQSKTQSKDQSKEHPKQQKTQTTEEQPKQQIITRAKELQQAAKVTPINKHKLRIATRGAVKPSDVDELNTSESIPPSPPVPMSPRTLVRRQRRAGGGDISVMNLTDAHQRRATRSQSAQSAPNKESDSSSDSEDEVRVSAAKPLTPTRTSLKRAHNVTPNSKGKTTNDAKPTSPQSQSPDQKRMRTDQQQSPRRNQRSISTPSRETVDVSNTMNSSEKRKRGRPRTRSLQSAESAKKNSEAARKSEGANLNEPLVAKQLTRVSFNERTTTVTRSRSDIGAMSLSRDRSTTRASSPTRTRSTTRASSPTRTRSTTRASSPKRTRSTTRASSPTRTRSTTRASSPTRTRSTIRASSPTLTRCTTRASSPSHTRSTTRASSPSRTNSTTRASSPSRFRSTKRPTSPSLTSSTTPMGLSTRTRSSTRTASPTRRQPIERASHTRSRSALRASSPLPQDEDRNGKGDAAPTHARSSTRSVSPTRCQSPIRATSTSFHTRATPPPRTRSATRSPSVARAASDVPSKTIPRSKSASGTVASADSDSHSKITEQALSTTSTGAIAATRSRSTVPPTKVQKTITTNDSLTKKQAENTLTTARRTRSSTRTPIDKVVASGDNKNSKAHDKRRKSTDANEVVSTPQTTGIMTRRRLSMSDARKDVESDGAQAKAVTTDSDGVSDATNVPLRRRSLRDKNVSAAVSEVNDTATAKKSSLRARPSKIPVRASNTKLATTMKPRHVALRVSSAMALAPKGLESGSSIGSGSGSGSGSSSTDEAMKTLGAAVLRRRALATKMTRINLTQRRKGNPVPMELARPKRVNTPVNNLAAGSNLSAVKKRSKLA